MNGRISLMLAPLHRDGIEHITSAPRWAPPTDAEGYWHIPRSISAEEFGNGRVLFWCGGERDMKLARLTDREPAENRCGTCIGRAAGFERESGAVFQPRSAFDPPRICPVLVGEGEFCRLCGGKIRLRRNYCHYHEAQHRPGPRMAEHAPCPRHGWKHIVEEYDAHDRNRLTGRVVCNPRTWWNDPNECGYVLVDAAAAYADAWTTALLIEERRAQAAAYLNRRQRRRRALEPEGDSL